MTEEAKQGLFGAHTRADGGDAGGAAGDQASERGDRADLGEAIRALAGELAGEADAPDLFEPDEPVGLLEAAAEISLSQRRARGRPKGSTNKRNTAVFDYLESMGHRDPAITLSLFQSMDVAELARLLACKPKEAAALQISAAEKLLPYKYAKKPTELHVQGSGSGRPVMIVGELNMAFGPVSDDGFMSAGQPREKTVEHQEVSEAETVRRDGVVSHETAKPLKTQGD